MVRNCFVLLGMVFLILLAILGILLVIGFFDASGQPVRINGTPVSIPVIIDRINPIATRLAGTLAPAPAFTPTATPLPIPTGTPDPVIYRTTALLRLRQFSNAIEAFTQSNSRLRDEPSLYSNLEWRSEIRADLAVLVSSAGELGSIQPVPAEYQPINDLLVSIVPEAEALQANYLRGIDQGDEQAFRNAGENFDRIAAIMKQVQAAMLAAGWNP